MQAKGSIALSAGGTGGHLFPAEALAHELIARGWDVQLLTDKRATKFADRFPGSKMHVVASATPSGKNPLKLVSAGFTIWKGLRQARSLLVDIKPKAVVGFGGYPTIPPLISAGALCPTIIHEQNAVMGRANKLLSPRVTAIAGGFLEAKGELSGKIVETGNPVRPAVLEASEMRYKKPTTKGPLKIVVFGGSQGARFFSQTMPASFSALPDTLRKRLLVTQQARPEDEEAAKAAYAEAGIEAEVAPFFTDLPARIADAHLVIARSGASTVTEIGAIGRPAIFVPYPHALDHDQAANAAQMEAAGGALVRREQDLSKDVMTNELNNLLSDASKLDMMAKAAHAAGKRDAARLLANLTEAMADGQSVGSFKAALAWVHDRNSQ
ncbi:MAG: undecaprenyldiphospho-muramoylpentapeptide beta-N-acetylglucosaminyltransferase [Pseudomonadota bacterium]